MATSTTSAIASASLQAASQATSTASKSDKTSTVDYNQFLQLLVAELKNQDPTNPAKPTEFISQLASFSVVEQQVRGNSTLDALLSAQAYGLIGKTVSSTDGSVSGTVVSVTTTTGGQVTLTLNNGSKLSLADGITVRQS